MLHITQAATHRPTLCADLVLTHLPLVIPSMPGNNQSFDVDACMRYIFGEENEPEHVREQQLHQAVEAPWPIGSDIGVTVLGRTIDILSRRHDVTPTMRLYLPRVEA